MPTQLSWTEKQIAVARLLEEGKEFKDILALGYTKNMISRVKTALGEGQKPPAAKPGGGESEQESSRTSQSLITVTGPNKSSPIVFKVGRQDIVLDPIELYKQYSYYKDFSSRDGITNTFSECLTFGIQMLWILTQDIPITKNMLVAILYGHTGGD